MFSLSNVILLMLLTVVATSQLDLVSIDVENWESAPVSIVDPRELSWNYGVWMYDHKAFNRQNTALNFSSTQLAKLTRQLVNLSTTLSHPTISIRLITICSLFSPSFDFHRGKLYGESEVPKQRVHRSKEMTCSSPCPLT